MIHSLVVVNTIRNTVPLRPDDVAALGIEPLSARSVILSALLGTHPPTLSGRSLVAFTELFGIRAGTARTSLSRMVTNGELISTDGRYSLAGRLLERQREQDGGQTVDSADWNRDWIVAVAASDRRSMAERRAFRESMIGSRLGELRPDIWMRPANTPGPPRLPDILITSGPLDCDDVDDVVARLWPLSELEASAQALHDALTRQRSAIDGGDLEQLPQTFMVAAAAVRFLRIEPQLPVALAPPMWTASALRPLYDDYNRAFQSQLRIFFAATR
jgi:phenylacetic acid degradation operon negative regulatory protein